MAIPYAMSVIWFEFKSPVSSHQSERSERDAQCAHRLHIGIGEDPLAHISQGAQRGSVMHTPDYALLPNGGNGSLVSTLIDLNMGTSGNNTDLFSSNGTDPFARNEELAQIEIMVLSITFVVAVIGNVSVLLAVHNTKKKISRMHLFIKHLSLADLVVAFFQVLPQLCWKITFRFYGPDILCRIVKHLQVMGMFASTYMMVMMTLDRYIAICHPLKTLQQSSQRSYIMIISTWVCSLVLSIPQYFIFSLSEIETGSGVYDCWAHFYDLWGAKAYITWITVGIFLVPVIILMMCYGFICDSIWKNIKFKKRKGTAGGATKNGLIGKNSVSSITTISRAKLRTVKMTFVIVVAYVVCWAPFFTVQMWSVWDEDFQWVGEYWQTQHAVVPTVAKNVNCPATCVKDPCAHSFYAHVW